MRHPIEIFKSGTHVAMSGASHSFSDSDLDAIAGSYDPAVHEAPIVVGHPVDNAPAFGWVKGLTRKGSTLEAGAEQLESSFVEAVKAGRFKKVSASFYTPDSPSNPKPGGYYLRHVGFLGAQPPAVKGLKDASFAGGADDFVSIELAEGDGADDIGAIKEALDTGSVLGRLRAWFIKMFGQENADEALPLDAVGGSAPAAAADAGAADLAEPDPTKLTDELVKLLGELVPADKADATKKAIEELLTKELAAAMPADGAAKDAPKDKAPPAPPPPPPANHAEPSPQEKALAVREAAVKKRELELRRDEHAGFIEGLLRDGRPMPAKKDAIIGLLTALDAVPAGSVSFGEGEKRSAVDVFKELLARIPPNIVFREVAGGSFVESDDPAVLGKAAAKYQDEVIAKGGFITTTDAVNHVKGTNR